MLLLVNLEILILRPSENTKGTLLKENIDYHRFQVPIKIIFLIFNVNKNFPKRMSDSLTTPNTTQAQVAVYVFRYGLKLNLFSAHY